MSTAADSIKCSCLPFQFGGFVWICILHHFWEMDRVAINGHQIVKVAYTSVTFSDNHAITAS